MTKNGNIDAELKELRSNSNPEVSSRLLFMAIKWAKSLPSFSQLNVNDQAS